MIPHSVFDNRPIVVAIAGPNGAGKTSFYNAFLRQSGLRLVNADVLASALNLGCLRGRRSGRVDPPGIAEPAREFRL
jgi:hypothetical protein